MDAVGDAIEITVLDNGVGMPKERLNWLQQHIEQSANMDMEHDAETGIGLANVNERIVRLFGEDYGISISSSEGVGTAVCIRVPNENKEQL